MDNEVMTDSREQSVLASSQFDKSSSLCAPQLATLWQQMLHEACGCNDPLVRGLLATGVRNHADFASALAALLGRKLGARSVAADALSELVQEGFEAAPAIVCAAAA